MSPNQPMSRDSAIHDLNLRVLDSIHNTIGVFKDVVKTADDYTKAMKYAAKQGAKLAVALNSVAQQAASAKSTTHDLGVGVHEMAEAQRQLQRANHSVGNEIVKISANITGFLQSYEKEVKEWQRTYQTKCKQMEKGIREAEKRSKDKNIKRNQQDLLKQMNLIADAVKGYEAMRQDALRETLIHERKRYCFILRQFCGMLKLEAGFSEQNCRHLEIKLPEWVRLGAIAEILPPEAEQLVKNPQRTLVSLGGVGQDTGDGIYDDFAAGLDFDEEPRDNFNGGSMGHRMPPQQQFSSQPPQQQFSSQPPQQQFSSQPPQQQFSSRPPQQQFGTQSSRRSTGSGSVGSNTSDSVLPGMLGGSMNLPPPPPGGMVGSRPPTIRSGMGGGGPAPPPMMGGGGPAPPPMMGGGGPPRGMGGGGPPPPPMMGAPMMGSGGGPPPPPMMGAPMMGGGGPPPPPMMGGGGPPPPPMMGGGGPAPPPMMGGGGPQPPSMMGGGGPPPPGGGALGENEYKAQWSYAPSDPNGLHFEEGDTILVETPEEDGWLYGECNGKEGWFPESYVSR